ncbi:MAG: TrkA family potassium uptake protein [Candidatus Riflebacteria bacterium]|nr:TrkA family potassium uptake protein [Candidatus Riflebacteria bacterium]
MKIIICGGGQALYFLSRNFISKGYEVAIVNQSREECIQFARQIRVGILCGDASNEDILQQAGAMGADALLAITPKDQDNLVICQLASHKFGIPRTVALANDPDNAKVFEKMGVSAFSTTQIIGSLIEQRASLEQIINLLPIEEGKVNVTEILLDIDSPVSGKFLKDIELPENSLVAVVIRNNISIVPRGGNDLQAGDRVVLITLSENHGKVMKMFTSRKSLYHKHQK